MINLLAKIIKKKGRGLKSIKLEMKKKLQWNPHQYKESYDYYKQQYTNKLDNLEEMKKFLGTISQDWARKK